jgi:hypothetical protein
MKRLVIRVLISVMAFFLGMAVSRLTTAETPTVKELPKLETFSRPTLPTPVLPVPQVPLPPVVAQPESDVIVDFQVGKFVPDGYYYFTGKAPKGFEEFGGFDLSVWEDKGEKHSEIAIDVPNATEYTGNSARFALITKDRLFFVTTTFDSGFEYRFEGQFLRAGVVSDASAGKAVLRGKLTKTKNGRTIAEREVSFQIEVHGC